jgi:hypothetical protein
MQFKTYEIIYFWNFPFNIFRPGFISVTETIENETVDKLFSPLNGT